MHSKIFAVLGEVLEGLEASLSPAGQHNQEPRRGSDVVNAKVAKKCKKKKPFFITLLVLDDGIESTSNFKISLVPRLLFDVKVK